MQLVELQEISARLVEQGVALFAISYDSVDALHAFGTRHAIAYPLLSDEGSHVIRALGLLDEHLDEHHAEFGVAVREDQRGVCYPGVFLLDQQGVVIQRRFQRNYRVRESGAGLLELALGIVSPDAAPVGDVAHEHVRIRTHIDSSTYWRYQRLNALVDLDIAEGWHVYAAPVPADYVPLSIEVSGAAMQVGQPMWPESTSFAFPSLEEELQTLEGKFRVSVPFEFIVQRGEPMGDRTVHVTVRYQACSRTVCMPPSQATFDLMLKERAAAD